LQLRTFGVLNDLAALRSDDPEFRSALRWRVIHDGVIELRRRVTEINVLAGVQRPSGLMCPWRPDESNPYQGWLPDFPDELDVELQADSGREQIRKS